LRLEDPQEFCLALRCITVIQKLKETGAVVFGRLNIDEFAMAARLKIPRLWSREIRGTRSASLCSSGGSAAAVAATNALPAIGLDTGVPFASQRRCAAGVGLKADLWPCLALWPGGFCASLDKSALHKNVRDAATLLNVLSGHDDRDSTSVPHPVPRLRTGAHRRHQGNQVGLPKEYFIEWHRISQVDQAVQAAIKQIEENLARKSSRFPSAYRICRGYLLTSWPPLEASQPSPASTVFVTGCLRVEGKDPRFNFTGKHVEQGFRPGVKRRIYPRHLRLSSGYYDATICARQKVRTLIRQDFLQSLRKSRLIVIYATTPTAAFKVGEK